MTSSKNTIPKHVSSLPDIERNICVPYTSFFYLPLINTNKK